MKQSSTGLISSPSTRLGRCVRAALGLPRLLRAPPTINDRFTIREATEHVKKASPAVVSHEAAAPPRGRNRRGCCSVTPQRTSVLDPTEPPAYTGRRGRQGQLKSQRDSGHARPAGRTATSGQGRRFD